MELSVKCMVSPVTALAVCQNKIICGCGNELSVFDLNTWKRVTKAAAFVGATIHSIVKGPSTEKGTVLCIFGAKQACVVFVRDEEIITKSQVLRAQDWILDALWLHSQNGPSCIALALAHNSTIKWDWHENKVIQVKDCTEKCILYCSRFIGNTWDNLMFAGGTVFNSIVLWPVCEEKEESCLETKKPVGVMHTFSGHKGVIFSIRYHYKLRLLCSVSDDRSIRMWQLNFPSNNSCDGIPSIADWGQMKSHLMFSLFGHAARVWDMALMSTCFASVGEDATCFVWNYDGKVIQKFKGHKGKSIWSLAASSDEKFVVTGGGDASIRLWDLKGSSDLQSSSTVIPLDSADQENDFPRIVKLLNLDTVLIMMNSGSLYAYHIEKQHSQQIFSDPEYKSYSVVSVDPNQTSFAVGSIAGKIKIAFCKESDDMDWELTDVSLFDGKVLGLVWINNKHLFCSGPNGAFLLLKIAYNRYASGKYDNITVTTQQKFQLPASKHRWVTGACIVKTLDTIDRAAAEADTQEQDYLICGDKDGSVYLYPGSALCGDVSNDAAVQPLQCFHRVHGKTGVTSVCERKGFVYTTGRDGFYREWRVEGGVLTQLHAHKVLKGLEWIDHLQWRDEDLHVYGFFSSQFVVWSVTYNQQLMSVQCGGGHRAWGCLCEDDRSRFVYLKAGQVCMVVSGFQSKQALIQPEFHGREVCDVKFVQWQKDWKLLPHVVCSASEDTSIVVSMFCDQGKFTQWIPLVTLKGHLSSVRTLALCSSKQSSNKNVAANDIENTSILFSGGGRAEIRAWRLNFSEASCNNSISDKEVNHKFDGGAGNIGLQNETFTQCGKEEKDNIYENADRQKESQSKKQFQQSLAKLPTGANLETTVSDSTTNLDGELSTSKLSCQPEHLCTHFLGESRHKNKFGPWKSRKLKLDPETRVMAIAASPACDIVVHRRDGGTGGDSTGTDDKILSYLSDLYVLSIAGSDGHLRVMSFSSSEKQFSQIDTTFHHKCCVLKTSHYIHKHINNQRQSFILSASTRGDIVFWDLTSLVLNHVNKTSLPPGGKDQNFYAYQAMERTEESESCDYVNFTSVQTGRKGIKAEEQETLQPILSVTAHQSGVNSLHILQCSDTSALVASGGDDNAIAIHKVEICGPRVTVVATGSKVDAHATQITGIWLVTPTLLVSTSIDQRVIVWRLTYQEDLIQLTMVACKYITIADVSCLDVQFIRNSVYLCIAGEGVCLIKLNTSFERNISASLIQTCG